MIRRDYKCIVLAHLFYKAGQPCIKLAERSRVSLNVSPMTIQHIKVYQIGKANPLKIHLYHIQQTLHAVNVAIGFIAVRYPVSGKDI